MPTTAIKIDSKLKEQLEKDAKASFRTTSGQANYYIKLGRHVHQNQLELARQIMEEPNGKPD